MKKMESMDTALPDGMDELLQIRYIKLHFELEILRDGRLPRHKSSALRGGMGQMLLMSNCIRDKNCDKCDFEEDCLVRRMMYPKMEIRPKFMTQQDSEGYILECENHDEVFSAGDTLDFNLLLLGRTIVYFHQFLQAFYYLGMQGLGNERVPFRVHHVTNTTRELIVEGSDIYMENFHILKLADYVSYRLGKAIIHDSNTLVFHSPLTMKYKGDFQEKLDPEAILAAVERRLYILNCFEGKRENEDYARVQIQGHIPAFAGQQARIVKIPRYSGTQNKKVSFQGIRGYCILSEVDDVARTLLIAGELIHIGKNTSFGFGRYTLMPRLSSGRRA